MLKINSQQFKEWARANRLLALAVCKAQAAAEITREHVESYTRPIFHSYGFVFCGDLAARLDKREGPKFLGKPLSSPDDLSLCDDPRVNEYFEACDTAHRTNGYPNIPKGHCPALRMESLLIKAQGELIEAAKPLAGIERYMLLGSGKEEQYLELLIKACLAEASDEEIDQYVNNAARDRKGHHKSNA